MYTGITNLLLGQLIYCVLNRKKLQITFEISWKEFQLKNKICDWILFNKKVNLNIKSIHFYP